MNTPLPVLSPLGSETRRYSVDTFLAAGGMGAIYLGRQFGAAGFAKTVVLKQLRSELVSRSEYRDRFIREAKISASLDHVNVVRTLDLVRIGKSYFIVMEYVPGVDLRLFLRRVRLLRRRLEVGPVLHIGLEVGSALLYAHPLGILHRDVSPSNILLGQTGDVKLSDFGIATLSGPFTWARQQALPPSERIEGKLGYMAPEQICHGWADPRADLFSLAVCLWEALTGERLFVTDGVDDPSKLSAQPIPELWKKRPDLPLADLDGVLRTALAPDPGRRFSSADSFVGALRDVARRSKLEMTPAAFARYLEETAGPPSSWRDQQPLLGANTSTHPLQPAQDRSDRDGAEPRAAGAAIASGGRTPRLARSWA
jgi:serine/threonine-protein kinase